MPVFHRPRGRAVLSAFALCGVAPLSIAQTAAAGAADPGVPERSLGVVTVTSGRPTSLPTQIPATMEGVTRDEIERQVNATDAEDALKYFPSLLVRKRFVGDHNHAILSTRASGTGNSARSLVFADGILLSNLLGNGINGLNYPPRWGMVTPEEIDRVDVMYGPFSAAYPGNSAGAVVDYQTRMPDRLEAHAALGHAAQPFELYDQRRVYRSWQASASVGSREGRWSYWLAVNRTDTEGQPLTFATRLTSAGAAGSAGTAVTGATLGANNANSPWYIVGDGTRYHSVQDHAKAKLAFDLTPTMRASYTLGLWQNTSQGSAVTYLRDRAGNPVYGGPVNIGGLAFVGSAALSGSDFTLSRQASTHVIHGLSLKTSTRETFDWEVAASLYDYASDTLRQNAPTNLLPGAADGGPGTLIDGSGTGWNTLAFRGIWRPGGITGEHVVEFGVQRDDYRLRMKTWTVTGDWRSDGGASVASGVRGDTALTSVWGQDTWVFLPGWKAVLGLRAERWQAGDGLTRFPGGAATSFPARDVQALSPKAAVSRRWAPDVVVQAAIGRAVRFPTVSELYGATATTNTQYVNDPFLAPERSWTGELSVRKTYEKALVRVTVFAETTRDALYAQTVFDPAANRNVSRVQNVGRIDTQGLEAAVNAADAFVRGLDLQGSVTYAHSIIEENAGFVATPGDTLGKWQPNVPKWRATLLATYRLDDRWSGSVGVRYSGAQYRTLNNADVNGDTYMGVSPFFTVDLRAVCRLDRTWTAAFGIDNVNNDRYWNFHPYPQRTFHASLRADL